MVVLGVGTVVVAMGAVLCVEDTYGSNELMGVLISNGGGGGFNGDGGGWWCIAVVVGVVVVCGEGAGDCSAGIGPNCSSSISINSFVCSCWWGIETFCGGGTRNAEVR